MKSIKPGRGPSTMGVVGGIIAAIAGVMWTITAANMGAGASFTAFGVLFVIAAISGIIYNYKNATGKDRMSEFDIVDETEEKDPFNKQVRSKYTKEEQENISSISNETNKYCPYCGSNLKSDFVYCPNCGKKIQ